MQEGDNVQLHWGYDMQETALRTSRFRIIDHAGHEGKWRIGYHCPSCGKFYATARYTFETDDALLGSGKSARCCGRELSLPHAFERTEDIETFLRSINRNAGGTRAVLIAKKHVISARFRPDAKPDTPLH